MPLIFIHGVNVRKTGKNNPPEKYDLQVSDREKMFKKYFLDSLFNNPDAVKILDPFWGKYGAIFPWNHSYLSRSGIDFLHPSDPSQEQSDEQAAGLIAYYLRNRPSSGQNEWQRPILQIAKDSIIDAFDIVIALSEIYSSKGLAENVFEHRRLVSEYADANPHPKWLMETETDQQFLKRLRAECVTWSESRPKEVLNHNVSFDELGGGNGWDKFFESSHRLIRKIPRLSGHVFPFLIKPFSIAKSRPS